MKYNKPDILLKQKVGWLSEQGPDTDIAISTRIRFARNLDNAPFPINASDKELKAVSSELTEAIKKAYTAFDKITFKIQQLAEIDREILFERRLISREMINPRPEALLIVTQDETLSFMINEEDHLRLQAIKPGFQLKSVLNEINQVDDELCGMLPYAFDDVLGFLTSCPTNVGTGMRSSVMLHLPALVLSGQIDTVIRGISKLRLEARGIFGEGSDNIGNLYQISNQSTLGESEEQIVQRLEYVVKQIIAHERKTRIKLLKEKRNYLLDHVGRAYGTLLHSYIISSEEAVASLSMLRLGVYMNMFSSIDIHTVNELFIRCQPAHLQKYAGKEVNTEERDVLRANLLRTKLRR